MIACHCKSPCVIVFIQLDSISVKEQFGKSVRLIWSLVRFRNVICSNNILYFAQHLDIFMLFNCLLSEGSKMTYCFIYSDVQLHFLFERSFILFHVDYILMVDKMEKIYTFIKRIFLNYDGKSSGKYLSKLDIDFVVIKWCTKRSGHLSNALHY